MSKSKKDRQPDLTVRLEDCEVQTFPHGGPGGQHANRNQTAVRIIHHPSGARGESREFKSQQQNKRAAMTRLSQTPQFRYWAHEQIRYMETGKTLEERVAEWMTDDKIKTEYKADGRWVEEQHDE